MIRLPGSGGTCKSLPDPGLFGPAQDFRAQGLYKSGNGKDTGLRTPLEWKKWYRKKAGDKAYRYEGPLGMAVGSGHEIGGTSLHVWAPEADAMTLNLYRDGEEGECVRRIPMEKKDGTVFVFSTEENLSGTYYDLEVRFGDEVTRTIDPYAKACGRNGLRAAFLDLRETDPAGWEKDKAPAAQAESVIYEVHVKEFSWDPSGGFPEKKAGTYAAFGCSGTSLPGRPDVPTGLSYVKSLGVTHVQLMPVYDFGSVEEGGAADAFNWGYDPVNWNIPEGSYATNAADARVRIRELKEAVMAIHRAGMRVVMDVVYNHTFSLDTSLQKTMPWYYYRVDGKGNLSNGSGCGNDIASERTMCARLILDSVLYWAEEYHIDGFRFDLMGLFEADFMNRVRHALDKRFGKGEKLLYGEPWAAGETAHEGDAPLASYGNAGLLDESVGAFGDRLRDAVKGSVFDASDWGYVGGNFGARAGVRAGILADVQEAGGPFRAPSQVIAYVSAHDNHSLWDKLVSGSWSEEETRRRYRMAAGIWLMCQGRPFLLAGEEFARTKDGIENAYNAPIRINRLDWSALVREHSMVDYYRGLIGLRKKIPALTDKSGKAYARVSFPEVKEPLLVWCFAGDMGDAWEQVIVAANPLEETETVTLPEGTWQVLADADRSDLWKGRVRACTGSCRLAPLSVTVLGFLAG